MFSGNIYQPLTDLQRLTQPTPGGLCYVDVVPVDDVLYIPDIDPAYETIINKVRLKDGKKWFRLPVPDRGRSLTETPQSNDGGDYMESEVNAFLPFDSATNEVVLMKMRQYRYIVVVAQANGLQKLLGSLDNPVFIQRSFDSGADGNADMGSTLQFSWTSANGAVVYLGMPSDSEVVTVPPLYVLGSGSGVGITNGDNNLLGINN